MNLSTLRAHVNKINMLDLLDECIVETKDVFIELIRSQIESGYAGDIMLPAYKSDKYASIKQKRGSKAPFGITDLKYTGKFLNALELKSFKKSVLIRSVDSKKSIIHKKYGFGIYNPNSSNFSFYVNEVIQPLILKKIKDGL